MSRKRKKGVQKTFAYLRKDTRQGRNAESKLVYSWHFWIVLTNPNAAGEVAVITVSSWDEADTAQNPAVIIDPEEENHSYFRRMSYVRYDGDNFLIVKAGDIQLWIKSARATREDDVREALVDRIIDNVETNGEADYFKIAFIADNRHNLFSARKNGASGRRRRR
ncbi:MAG: hypothetical protein OXU29_10015 [Gammaproteobacteria bacterium]|nr:hypothetical protein [Gammaproteobacteria bacterium]